jgi:hypothetical protein
MMSGWSWVLGDRPESPRKTAQTLENSEKENNEEAGSEGAEIDHENEVDRAEILPPTIAPLVCVRARMSITEEYM